MDIVGENHVLDEVPLPPQAGNVDCSYLEEHGAEKEVVIVIFRLS